MDNKSLIRRRCLFFLLGLALMAASLACGLAASAPIAHSAPNATQLVEALTELPSPPAPTLAPLSPSSALPVAPPPAIPEYRRLTLEYPPSMRTGDSDVVRLTLEVDTLGNITPTAEIAGNTVKGQIVQIPNLYETHNVVAEARLDLTGLQVEPTDPVYEPLLPGRSLTFFWSIHPVSAGTFQGTAWLFLIFVDKVSQAESQTAIGAQPIEIDASNFLGLNGGAARTVGSLGSVIGAILGFPFVTDVLKWLWERIRRGRI